MTRRSSALRLPAAREQRALIDLCYRLDLDDAALVAEIGAWWQRLGPAGPMGVIASSMQPDGAGKLAIDPVGYGRRETLDTLHTVFAATGERAKAMMAEWSPQFNAATDFPHVESGLAVSRRYGASDFVGFLAPTGTGHVLMLGTPVEAHAGLARRPARRDGRVRVSPRRIMAAASLVARRRPLGGPRRGGGAPRRAGRSRRRRGARPRSARDDPSHGAREGARALETRADAAPLWPELVAGRWTLVDSFDHDGRRYVVAWRNPPDAPRTRLSPRAQEVLSRTARGEPTKVIAAALGVGEPVVSTTLHAAMKALRVERVADLIRLNAEAPLDVVFRDEALTAVALAPAARGALDALTPTEREVLAELVRGASNGAIAARRNRSAHRRQPGRQRLREAAGRLAAGPPGEARGTLTAKRSGRRHAPTIDRALSDRSSQRAEID